MRLLCTNYDCDNRSQCIKTCPCSNCDMSYQCIKDYVEAEESKAEPPYILVSKDHYVFKEEHTITFKEGTQFSTLEELVLYIDLTGLKDKQLAIINISGGEFWLYTIPINEFSETYRDENHKGHKLLCDYLHWKDNF